MWFCGRQSLDNRYKNKLMKNEWFDEGLTKAATFDYKRCESGVLDDGLTIALS